jgi:hypothetical protein
MVDLTKYGFKVVGRAPRTEAGILEPFAKAGLGISWSDANTAVIDWKKGTTTLHIPKDDGAFNIKALSKLNGKTAVEPMLLEEGNFEHLASLLVDASKWDDEIIVDRYKLERKLAFTYVYDKSGLNIQTGYASEENDEVSCFVFRRSEGDYRGIKRQAYKPGTTHKQLVDITIAALRQADIIWD